MRLLPLISHLITASTVLFACCAYAASTGKGTEPLDRSENPEMFVDLKKTDSEKATTEGKTDQEPKRTETTSFKPKGVGLDPHHWSISYETSPDLLQIPHNNLTLPALYLREQRGGPEDAVIIVYAPQTPPGQDALLDSLRNLLPARGVACLSIVYDVPASSTGNTTSQGEPAKTGLSQLLHSAISFLHDQGHVNTGIVIGVAASHTVLAETPISSPMGAHAWIWLSPAADRTNVTKLGDIPMPILEIGQNRSDIAFRRSIKNPLYQYRHLWGSKYGAASAALPIAKAIQGFLKKNRYFEPSKQGTDQPKVFKGTYTGGQ